MLASRLLKSRVAVLTAATLRNTSFQQTCALFTESQHDRTSHLHPKPNLEGNSNSRNFERSSILRAEPNSKKKPAGSNPTLYVGVEPDSEVRPNPLVEPNFKESSTGHADGESPDIREDPGTDNSAESEIITLWASYRVRGEKLQELRNNGMIPGIVSDYDAERGTTYNYYIVLQRKEVWGNLTRMGRKDFMSCFYNLALRDRPDSDQIEHTVKVYPSKLYLIDGRRSILNLAFVRVRRNVKLRMMIPLKFRGRTVCPGLIKGGTLVVLKKALNCFVFPDEVPPYIEVDVSRLNVGQRILVNDLDLDLAHRRQAGLVVCEVKKYRFVRPSRSRSLARSSTDIGPPKYGW